MRLVDGIYYEDEEKIPDLGSWVNVAKEGDVVRSYRGLSKDFSKLPTIAKFPQYKNTIQSGSLAIACDTQDSKMYEATTDTWY